MFIKVADVTEVKAQIKLRFRDVRANPCVVTRSFQLTQKSGGKLEKKDLDQVIQTVDEKTGEKVSVSRKCADINATVPDMVSFFSFHLCTGDWTDGPCVVVADGRE